MWTIENTSLHRGAVFLLHKALPRPCSFSFLLPAAATTTSLFSQRSTALFAAMHSSGPSPSEGTVHLQVASSSRGRLIQQLQPCTKSLKGQLNSEARRQHPWSVGTRRFELSIEYIILAHRKYRIATPWAPPPSSAMLSLNPMMALAPYFAA